jgi:glycosyltransferase involved in cell wall biosynthesis
VIARDEEATIERCLTSLRWADSLLVVLDDRTTDATAERAALCGARVVVNRFEDYGRQRNAALRVAETDWLLFVDADEVVPPELESEVRAVITGERPAAGYWIPRRNILFGHWVRHTGWSPDYQLRLLRVEKAKYREDRSVHELVELEGEAGHLASRLIHYNYASLGQFLSKQRVYSSMEASDMYRRGVKPKPQNYILQPWRQFWRRYVTFQGYRDGWLGLLLSSLLAYYELRTYVRLTALWRSGSAHSS